MEQPTERSDGGGGEALPTRLYLLGKGQCLLETDGESEPGVRPGSASAATAVTLVRPHGQPSGGLTGELRCTGVLTVTDAHKWRGHHSQELIWTPFLSSSSGVGGLLHFRWTNREAAAHLGT